LKAQIPHHIHLHLYGGNCHHISTFDTEQESTLAYARAAREHGGGKKRPNYESIEAVEEAAAQALAYDKAAREHVEGKKPLNYDSIKAAEEAAAEAEAEHTLVHDMGAEPKKPRQPSGC
jgi:hypothetical protein